jgi:hypothetical protein
LYITNDGGSQIVKMTHAGRLVLVAGARGRAGMPQAGQLAAATSADGPDGIAFDGAGDLFVAGFDTKTLFMIAPDGRVSLPMGTAGFYPRGPGGLAATPGGSVLAMNTGQIDRLTSHGVQVLDNLLTSPPAGITGFVPDGIAIAPDGTVYLDTWLGNRYASKTALRGGLGELRPVGRVEGLHRGQSVRPVLSAPDLRERLLRGRVRGLRQRSQHIRGLVEPAAALAGLGEHLPQPAPEPQRPVTDGQYRGAHAPAGAVPQQVRPRLRRLAVPVSQGDERWGRAAA